MKQLPLFSKAIADAHRARCFSIVENKLEVWVRQSKYGWSGKKLRSLFERKAATMRGEKGSAKDTSPSNAIPDFPKLSLAGRRFVRRIIRFIDVENGFIAPAETIKVFAEEVENHWYHNAAPLPRICRLVNETLKGVFDYDSYVNHSKDNTMFGGFHLMKEVLKQLKYCPYCNTDMVYAMKLPGNDRPYKSAFDHFFPRSRYPFLGLSLYNLLPACDRCNSKFKRSLYKESLSTFHPYLDDVDAKTQFVLIGLTNEMRYREPTVNNLQVILDAKPPVQVGTQMFLDNYQKMFKINEVYSLLYNDQALRLYHLASTMNEAYLQEVSKRFKTAGLQVDVAKLLLGAPLQRNKIDWHHIAKLKLDILEQYCKIKFEK